MYITVSNHILLTRQLIPSKNLALERTTGSLRRKKDYTNLLKFFA